MTEFVHNNAKNASTGHNPFELNYGYHLRVFLKEHINSGSRSCSANKLVEEQKELIEICYQNSFHAQELQKRVHDKGVKN